MNKVWNKSKEFLYEKILKKKKKEGRDNERTNSGTHNTACVNTTCVRSSTYNATVSDYYIGVDTTEASTIYLPTPVRDGKVIVVKSEMKPPLGRRKITITTTDGSLIDGYSELTISVSHASQKIIFRDGNWRVI